MTPRRLRRLLAAAAGCLVLPVGLGAGAAPGHAAEGCERDCGELRVSIQSGPVIWEDPGPELENQVFVFLSEPAAESVTVWFQTADGTAKAPEDYAAIDELVTVPAGEQKVAVPIEVEADGIREPDEFFTATISEPSVGQVGVGETKVTIRDGMPRRRG